MSHYDYAILGGGAAGLSLLCHLHRAGALAGKKTLIVEPEVKNRHDRTWSFWEREAGPFEEIVHHRWSSIGVHNDQQQATYKLGDFTYKLIRSTEFYAYCDRRIDSLPHVERIQAFATDIEPAEKGVSFSINEKEYSANWAFSSIPRPLVHDQVKQPYLDQHFRGWFIRTERPVFDADHATLMDFRTEQAGETRFFYVLPFSPTEAMVEIAIFSNDIMSPAGYDTLISAYLSDHWNLHPQGNNAAKKDACYFEVYHTEQGIIPMTTYPYPRQNGHLIYIGLGGGHARPSTGYTFYNMQRQLQGLANDISKKGVAVQAARPWPARHLLYDATLLDILENNKLPGADLFPDLFQRNPTSRVLDFLNGDTSLVEELQLMSTTDISAFGQAFLRQLGN